MNCHPELAVSDKTTLLYLWLSVQYLQGGRSASAIAITDIMAQWYAYLTDKHI